MELKKYIEIGEVIRIISDSSLIISILNLDPSAIPKAGDKIEIYSLGEPLYDSHGQKIADFNQVKDSLKIEKVENKYIICRKETIRPYFLSAAQSLADMFDPIEVGDVNIDHNEVSPLKDYNKKIKIGDLARLVVDNPEIVIE